MSPHVVISGSTGFVGSAIASHLASAGIRVKSLTRTQLLKPDSCDIDSYYNPIIVHCAWSGVHGKLRNASIQDDNIMICKSILAYAKQSRATAVIAFGSQAEYGNPNRRVKEDAPLSPTTLYGQRKIEAYNMISNGCCSLQIPLIWLRLFDPYGPGDHPDWFMPYVIRCALSNTSPKLTGCDQFWDYLYIADVCSAVSSIVSSCQVSKPVSGIYNLSSGSAVSLKSIVETVFQHVSPSSARPIYGAVPYRVDQVMHLEGCNDKFCQQYNWRPVVTLENGILKTINYFKALQE